MTAQLQLGVEPEAELLLLRKRLREKWPHLRKARKKAQAERDRLTAGLLKLKYDHTDSSIVVFGSLARDEFTRGSDVDWTLLLDGQSDPKHMDLTRDIDNTLRSLKTRAPRPGGTFGRFAVSHDLLHRIGGEDDTNRNTTQRILLLLESAVLGDDGAYERVIKNVLHRYVEEDASGGMPDPSIKVPRFLLNDIARYWRTLTVDFAHKRRLRDREGWALRTAKLRMSRKLIYTAGLLSCYSCEIGLKAEVGESQGMRTSRVVTHLAALVRKSPLDIVAGVILDYPSLYTPARALFGAYDEFLGILDAPKKRRHLEQLKPEDAYKDRLYEDVQRIGARFQGALEDIFFNHADTPLHDLTRRYGVF
jgi:predicted nucleotidyltransferase